MSTTPNVPTPNDTLLWTADSPYCRIVLWACAAENQQRIVLEYLSWADLSEPKTQARLGKEQTIPCLQTSSGPVTDSLRILSLLKGDAFPQWLNSEDGALYRCAEGQLTRVMYACYDGVREDTCERLWSDALAAIGRMLIVGDSVRRTVEDTWGLIAVHTFISFCVGLRPHFRSQIPAALNDFLHALETLPSFARMSRLISAVPHQIRCGIYGAAADGAESSGGAAR